MKISIRYGAAIFFSVVGVAICLWVLWGHTFDQHLNNIQQQQIGQQSRLLKQSFDEFSEKTASKLMQTIETEMVSVDQTNQFDRNQFVAVGLFGITDAGKLKLNWNRSKTAAFDAQTLDNLAKQTETKILDSSQVHWSFIEGLDNKKYLNVLVRLMVKEGNSETQQIAVGLLSLDVVNPLMTAFNEPGTEIFLVNADGKVISSLDARYLGTVIDQHPVYKNLLKSERSQSIVESETFAELDSFGAFEKTNTANVYAMINQPIMARGVLSWGTALQSVFVIVGFIALGFALNMLAFTKDRFELYNLRQRLDRSEEKIEAVKLSRPSDLERTQIERRVFNKTIHAIVGSIRASIYSLIGKVQVVRDRYDDEALQADVVYIEGELRTIRDTLEDLSWLDMNSEGLKAKPVALAETLQAKLEQHEFRAQIGSIRIENNVLPGTFVKCKSDDLNFVVETILEQCKHKRSLDVVGAEVIINSTNLGGIVRLDIKHYGISTSGLEVKRLFQVTDYEHINFTLSKLLLHSYGGALKVVPKGTETIYQVDIPKALAPKKEEEFIYEI